jgi:hypothetical protein
MTPTPDWKLKCFAWLPLDRWTTDTIMGEGVTDGNRYCKVCDDWIQDSEPVLEKHVKIHIQEEQKRQAKIKAEAAAERAEQKEFERQEREALKGTPADPRASKAPRNTSRPRAPRQDRSGAIPLLQEALTNLGEATAASLSEATGLDVGVVRSQIKKVPGMKIVGEVKSGGRGRPALIYGSAKSTTKEG